VPELQAVIALATQLKIGSGPSVGTRTSRTSRRAVQPKAVKSPKGPAQPKPKADGRESTAEFAAFKVADKKLKNLLKADPKRPLSLKDLEAKEPENPVLREFHVARETWFRCKAGLTSPKQQTESVAPTEASAKQVQPTAAPSKTAASEEKGSTKSVLSPKK
jgi:hypothetical protein